MKLDVSYTDHSHIIGKGGLTIKRVMEETGCHIHFPDSNRSNHQDKSNQVSIAGEIEGVERARARVRVRIFFRENTSGIWSRKSYTFCSLISIKLIFIKLRTLSMMLCILL